MEDGMKEFKCSEVVKIKLSELVEAIADEILVGKPALLANCIYINLEKEVIKQIEEIKSTFD
jgi:hypothetical protein